MAKSRVSVKKPQDSFSATVIIHELIYEAGNL